MPPGINAHGALGARFYVHERDRFVHSWPLRPAGGAETRAD
jgi:hypothetical protein